METKTKEDMAPAIITHKEYAAAIGKAYREGSDEEVASIRRSYFGQFVKQRTINRVVSAIGVKRLEASTCPHFNDIPLERWDALVRGLPLAIPVKATGTFYTISKGVCIAKEAARQYLEGRAGV